MGFLLNEQTVLEVTLFEQFLFKYANDLVFGVCLFVCLIDLNSVVLFWLNTLISRHICNKRSPGGG